MDVDRDDVVHLFGRLLAAAGAAGHAGIGDDEVERMRPVDVEQPGFELRGQGHVERRLGHRRTLCPAGCADLCDPLGVAADQRQEDTRPRIRARQRLAEAARRAGNEDAARVAHASPSSLFD